MRLQINWETLRIYKNFLTGCDQRVVERLKFCVSDRFEINKAKIGQFFLKRGSIDINGRDGAIAFFIVGTGESWRKSDQAFAVQGQQQFATCHVL